VLIPTLLLLVPFTYAAVVEFELTIQTTLLTLDGAIVPTLSATANGILPGPEIHATVGDILQLNVVNELDHGIAVHLHGIDQAGTPWYDGAAGFSQNPIPPNMSMSIRSLLNRPGTYYCTKLFIISRSCSL
jgi:FtsP/CotA-like multicopper oxidase with cupredoxin domain